MPVCWCCSCSTGVVVGHHFLTSFLPSFHHTFFHHYHGCYASFKKDPATGWVYMGKDAQSKRGVIFTNLRSHDIPGSENIYSYLMYVLWLTYWLTHCGYVHFSWWRIWKMWMWSMPSLRKCKLICGTSLYSYITWWHYFVYIYVMFCAGDTALVFA